MLMKSQVSFSVDFLDDSNLMKKVVKKIKAWS